ncbi:MAG: multidrug ABC transporter substrate-binding protein [Betaproteobacteria bacterium RIFCSPLOWO2_12_FULL_62_58]|nr:MAG: multidrug ABC transporter substrate-binding protein [Betaproteobacteria bacterium RIFCSPLOWO2_12_FULL_62_58]
MFGETLLLALREIRRNVLRSSLTILGVVIGVAAVITMVTIGGGATVQVANQIKSLGSNLLTVRPGQQPRGPGGARQAAKLFEVKDVEAIEREISGIAALTPISSKGMLAINADLNWSTVVTGTDNAYFKVRDWPLANGRVFTDSELRSGMMACILGATVRQKLFGAQDPLDATIRLGALSCQVIGVLAPKGQSTFGMDQDDLVVIPLRAFQRRLAGNQYVDTIYVSVRDGVATKKIQADIELLMRERRRLAPREEADFYVMDMQQIVSTVGGATQTLTALLGAVAAVSLLVGGIGIMNIMLVSVTERTREIGIRLAVGAMENEVLLQFLVEAVTLSLFGGMVGILAGVGAAAGGAALLNVPFVFNSWIVVVAFLFSGAVGVIFGYFPARKAAQLDPIEALRHE